jgi:hypothetical protein
MRRARQPQENHGSARDQDFVGALRRVFGDRWLGADRKDFPALAALPQQPYQGFPEAGLE